MDEKTFEVEVTSRQKSLYQVEAANAEAAEKIAETRWQRGEPSDIPGVDWMELVSTSSRAVADTTRQAQDEEVVFRFLRERERLLLLLGGEMLSATLNDAISATQAAADLGWVRSDSDAGNTVDTLRAARALERLCQKKRLVCFQRTRVRAGERGDIRLYCTPDYLDRLSASVTKQAPQRKRRVRRSAAL